MKRTIQIAVVLFALLPGIAKAQWTFDIVSVEAYINDHKKQTRFSFIFHTGLCLKFILSIAVPSRPSIRSHPHFCGIYSAYIPSAQ